VPEAQAVLDDSTRRVRLDRDTVVSGVHCAPTGREYAEFFVADGRLAECPLADDAVIAGHELRAGTWVVFRPDGRMRLAWLIEDTRVDGVLCKGSGYKEWVTTFHEDGSLATCYMPETTTIDGVPCRAGSIWGEVTGGVTVHFHPNGRLRSCALARATTIEGERHRAWSRVWFDETGALVGRDEER
jgi:hypothetical protein